MDPDKVKAFLAEYRDLVHRHGLGITGADTLPCVILQVSDPDAHVADIAAEQPSETKKNASRR